MTTTPATPTPPPRTGDDLARHGARDRPQYVAVQGLGYVGAAMAVAVAGARRADGSPAFTVHGFDLPTPEGRRRAESLAAGRFPFATTDDELVGATAAAAAEGTLHAGVDPDVVAEADVVVVDVPVDIDWRVAEPTLDLAPFEAAIRQVGARARPGALVLVETTVPPGTTEKVVAPVLDEECARRGLPAGSILVAHSYERVMPGPDYLASITRYWRVFAGLTPEAGDAAAAFLGAVIDTSEHPLSRLARPTASETAKVLENTFRATTIALMDEWARFAEVVGVDLFEVVDAIRARPTHANLRTPGFGVGGYCITKDPLFAELAARSLFDATVAMPLSTAAVGINGATPTGVLDRVDAALGGLAGRRLLLCGISYRSDVADTRWSPAEAFVRQARERGATVALHDPLVERWEELGEPVPSDLPPAADLDAVVFAVPHDDYRRLDLVHWLGEARPVVCDAFAVLAPGQRAALVALGVPLLDVGRGHEAPS